MYTHEDAIADGKADYLADQQERKNEHHRKYLSALQYYKNHCADILSEGDMEIMAERDVKYEEERYK